MLKGTYVKILTITVRYNTFNRNLEKKKRIIKH